MNTFNNTVVRFIAMLIFFFTWIDHKHNMVNGNKRNSNAPSWAWAKHEALNAFVKPPHSLFGEKVVLDYYSTGVMLFGVVRYVKDNLYLAYKNRVSDFPYPPRSIHYCLQVVQKNKNLGYNRFLRPERKNPFGDLPELNLTQHWGDDDDYEDDYDDDGDY